MKFFFSFLHSEIFHLCLRERMESPCLTCLAFCTYVSGAFVSSRKRGKKNQITHNRDINTHVNTIERTYIAAETLSVLKMTQEPTGKHINEKKC